MLVLNHKDEAQTLGLSGVALTVGSFDGVHRGHRRLIEVLKNEAPGAKLAVLTFDPHPERILSPEPPRQLFGKQDQIDVFEDLGVDYLFFIPFDKNLAAMEGRAFAEEYIFRLFKPVVIAVGYDFVFGKNRSGDFALLKTLVAGATTKVLQVPPVTDGGDIVSSSLIRNIIGSGDVERGAALLGRAFYILGHVKQGRQLGRQLGFPTANIALHGEMVPGPGVYQCSVMIGAENFPAVCNVGFNPTVSETREQKIEVHILDFHRDIYNQRVQVLFHRKLRDEKKFPSLEALKAQIAQDIELAKTFV